MGVNVGVVLLAHENLTRVAQVADHLCAQNVPVALHIDRRTIVAKPIHNHLANLSGLTLMDRRPTPWGSWALVDATLRSCQHLLKHNPEVTHIALLSGSCVPIRPIAELSTFLGEHPGTDFIQSVRAEAAEWVAGGLQVERFLYRFPVSFTRQKRLFDFLVKVQGRFPNLLKRKLPDGLIPCLGSQWWCLSRKTLCSILDDPELPALVRYFRAVWIPDEAFFQTMARKHSWSIEARSLTWAPFDKLGQAITLYDDHLDALKHAPEDLFLARKVWPGANNIYRYCLSNVREVESGCREPLQKLVVQAREVPRNTGSNRIPTRHPPPGSRPYLAVYGVDQLFQDLEAAIQKFGQGPWLGTLFVGSSGSDLITMGGLSKSVAVSRANPTAYLSNLLLDLPGRPVFAIESGAPPDAISAICADPNAHVVVISGAWCVQMQGDPGRSEMAFGVTQRAETELLAGFRRPSCSAKVQIWTLEQAARNPASVLASMGLPETAAKLQDLSLIPDYLVRMRNAGMNPTMTLGHDSFKRDAPHSVATRG